MERVQVLLHDGLVLEVPLEDPVVLGGEGLRDEVDQARHEVDGDDVTHDLQVEDLGVGLEGQVVPDQGGPGFLLTGVAQNLEAPEEVDEVDDLRQLEELGPLVDAVYLLEKNEKGEERNDVEPEPKLQVPSRYFASRHHQPAQLVLVNPEEVYDDVEKEHDRDDDVSVQKRVVQVGVEGDEHWQEQGDVNEANCQDLVPDPDEAAVRIQDTPLFLGIRVVNERVLVVFG